MQQVLDLGPQELTADSRKLPPSEQPNTNVLAFFFDGDHEMIFGHQILHL